MIDEHCLNVRLSDYLGRHGAEPQVEEGEEERAAPSDALIDEDAERR